MEYPPFWSCFAHFLGNFGGFGVFLRILVGFSSKMVPKHGFHDHKLFFYHCATSEITIVVSKPIQEGRRLGIMSILGVDRIMYHINEGVVPLKKIIAIFQENDSASPVKNLELSKLFHHRYFS